MKRCCFFILFSLFAYAATAQTSIFDALSKRQAGKGDVIINQPASVRKLVETHRPDETIVTVSDKKYLLVQGFRIQVFSGNNQRTSKQEALTKQSQINRLYGDVSTYVTYKAPFWRLRAGDYTSFEEAYCMMQRIISAFPSFRKEMYVVKEEVRIPVN
jgi:hypothetical protein